MLTTPLSLLSLVLLSTSSYAVPLERRAPPTLKVVVNPTGSGDACTPAQVNILKAALVEGASLATKAATALVLPGANTSDAATKWLGTITPANLATQVTKRFSNPAAAFTSAVTEVAAFGTDAAVYFFCPIKGNFPCEEADTLAETMNKLTGAMQNKIALCDIFFTGATTLAEDTNKYRTAVTAGGATTVKFPQPQSRGITLVHEAQHSLPILQSTTPTDDLEDIDDAYTPEAASKLPTPMKKQGNAENWNILAFLAEVAPARLRT